MKPPPGAPRTFEPEFVAALKHLFEERIAFNRVIGLEIVDVLPERVTGRLAKRPELIGHIGHDRLHGGVISTALDAMAGIACLAALGARHMDEPPEVRATRWPKLGTIDLRIDYLRPAVAARFALDAEVMRLGSRVASTRMSFRAESGELVATGSAAYIVS